MKRYLDEHDVYRIVDVSNQVSEVEGVLINKDDKRLKRLAHCEYLAQKVIGVYMEQGQLELLQKVGMVNGELTRFRDSLEQGDALVTQQVGVLLFLIEWGKMRMGKLKRITRKTKQGEAFIPLVGQIQDLIKEASDLMERNGWTTAGDVKLKKIESKGRRSSALDMLEGKGGVFELTAGATESKEKESVLVKQ